MEPFLDPNNPLFLQSLGIGQQNPAAAFGSLAPGGAVPGAAGAPGGAPGAPLDIRSPIQQQQDAQGAKPGFDPAKFNASLAQLQKTFGQQQQGGGMPPMAPMNLRPPQQVAMPPLGMLRGF